MRPDVADDPLLKAGAAVADPNVPLPAEAGPAAVAGPPDPAGEGCPPPLEWQEVLREFHATSQPWYLDRPRYRLTGRVFGKGRPLYFLNGIGGSHELFVLTTWLLKDEFRCVLFDYPGSEPSRRRESRAGLEELVSDLFAIADVCGDRVFEVLATSFGGLLALEAMRREPDRIPRAILQGAFAHRHLSAAERFLIRFFRWHPGPMRLIPGRRAIQQHNHRRWFPPFDTTRWDFFQDNSGRVSAAALANRAAIVRDNDLRPKLGRIQQPVLLVHGEGEGLVSESCHHVLEQGLPNARTEWMHGTGHFPYLTHPHRLAKVVRTFLLPPSGDNPSAGR